jgi:hypothetical protein
VARREVEEVDCRWVEVDVEAVFDTLENCGLVDIVVARVYYADSFWPALLCRTDRCPEDSFTTAASVTAEVVSIASVSIGVFWLPKWVEEAHNALPLLVCIVAAPFTTSSYRRDVFPVVVIGFAMLGFIILAFSRNPGQQQFSPGARRSAQMASHLLSEEAHDSGKEQE